MNLDLFICMRSFLSVAESGSFTKAALNLHVSISAITRQIQSLERYVGSTLLTRSTRKLQLTQAGEIYLECVKQIFEDINQANSSIKNITSQTPTGKIKLSMPGILQKGKYITSLYKFLIKYPQIDLEIDNYMSPLQLLENTSDIVISPFSISDKQFNCEDLFHSTKSVFAAPKYLEKNGIPKTVFDLEQHNCLVYAPASPNSEWEFANKTKIKVKGNYKVNSGVSLIPAAVAGIGLTWVEEDLPKNEVANGELVKLDIAPGPYSAIIRMYYLPIAYTGINKLLINWIKSEFKD